MLVSRLPYSKVTEAEFGVDTLPQACYNSTFAVTSRKSGEVHNEWALCVLCALMLSFGSGVAYYHGVTNYSYMMVRERGRGENGFGEPRAMTYEECKGLMGHLPFKVNLARDVAGVCFVLTSALTDFSWSWWWGEWVYMLLMVIFHGLTDLTIQSQKLMAIENAGAISVIPETLHIQLKRRNTVIPTHLKRTSGDEEEEEEDNYNSTIGIRTMISSSTSRLQTTDTSSSYTQLINALKAFASPLTIISVCAIYSLVVINAFLYSGLVGKFFILQVAHRCMAEAVMTFGRLEHLAVYENFGEGSPIKRSVKSCLFDAFFSIVGRLLLSNMGGEGGTLVNIFLMAVFQALFRATSIQRDLWAMSKFSSYRDLLTKNQKETTEKVKKLVTCSIFLQMIIESWSIIMSTLVYFIFSRHRMVFDFGYPTGEAVEAGTLGVQKMYELACEIGVGTANAQPPLPPAVSIMYLQKYEICSFGEILDDIDHHSLFLGHLCACITALLAAIVSFKSVPLAMFCESDDPCSCPRFFFKQYDKYCEVTAVSEEDFENSVTVTSAVLEEEESFTNNTLFYVLLGIVVLLINSLAAGVMITAMKRKKEAQELDAMKKKINDQKIDKDKMAMILQALGLNENHKAEPHASATTLIKIIPMLTKNNTKSTDSPRSASPTSPSPSSPKRKASPLSQTLAAPGSPKTENNEVFKKYESAKTVDLVSPRMQPANQEEQTDHVQQEHGKHEKMRLAQASTSVFKSLQIKSEEIEVLQYSIAKGAFGEIHKAQYKGQYVALKTLLHLEEDSLHEFKQEILLNAQLQHPNVVRLVGACWDRSMIAIVLEFAEGGSLDTALKANFKSGWNWSDPLLKIVIDIASGLEFMHRTPYYDDATQTLQNTILHRDMKPSNVLLTKSLTAKLADFGTSKAIDQSAEQTIVGTPVFMAPEVYQGGMYDHSADVFSFGMTVWAISVGHDKLFKRLIKKMRRKVGANSAAVQKVMHAIAVGELRPSLTEEVHNNMPASLRTLIESCWLHNKRQRPKMSEVLTTLKTTVSADIEAMFKSKLRFEVESLRGPTRG
ncbi:hypothetical protein TrST_g5299 [Triparma strigata]|uniref:Protein kinase domain-containing protein n=1 Tax=Triparma strigata TaxID=1606541 RepID=A0A9W7EY17_9STRA|nr:hypothetical protein TrST_g5299 [Triparma strigata]